MSVNILKMNSGTGGEMRPTRKSIGDKNGKRSIYVVEICYGGNWQPDIGYHNLIEASKDRIARIRYEGVKAKDVRISLYVRAEGK